MHTPVRFSDDLRHGDAAFVGQHFGIGRARTDVDAHVHELPADAAHPLPPIAGDAMPDLTDAPQLLDVQVHQLPPAAPTGSGGTARAGPPGG